jgi:hypothetical protein
MRMRIRRRRRRKIILIEEPGNQNVENMRPEIDSINLNRAFFIDIKTPNYASSLQSKNNSSHNSNTHQAAESNTGGSRILSWCWNAGGDWRSDSSVCSSVTGCNWTAGDSSGGDEGGGWGDDDRDGGGSAIVLLIVVFLIIVFLDWWSGGWLGGSSWSRSLSCARSSGWGYY